MTSVDIPPRIWEVIGIDLIGPFTRKDRNRTPLSNAGYRYVLTVIDYFSKWSEAFPLVSKDTVGIVEKLQTCIYRFGVPKKIISDRGGEFNSRAMDQFCSDNGIRHTCTSAYHPQANGLVEKFNSTLKRMINKTIEENGEEWKKYIEKCLFAYRCTIHSSSKFSPFYMLYLREPVLGSEQSLSWTQEDDQSEEAMGIDGAVERQVEKLAARRGEIHSAAVANLEIASKRQKVAYDNRHNVKTQIYKKGQKVLLKRFRREKGMGTVQQMPYEGPYEVFKYCGKGNYKLLKGYKVIGPYSHSSMKEWYVPAAPSATVLSDSGNINSTEECDVVQEECEVGDVDDNVLGGVMTENIGVNDQDDVNISVEVNNNQALVMPMTPDLFDDFIQPSGTPSFQVEIVSETDNLDEFLDSDEVCVEKVDRPKRGKKRMRQSSIYEYY